MSTTDHTLPDGKWTFDEDVTQVFEDMLRRSIPDYDGMRQRTFAVASRFVKAGTAIIDMGCSRGDAIKALLDQFGARCRFVGCEVSEPMLAAARVRFAGYINCGVVAIREVDLRHAFPEESASVVLSVLTLQFTPLEYRMQILERVYDRLQPGGAFLLVEKVIGGDGTLDNLFVDLYYQTKRAAGYSQEEIDRKRFSLEGVLVPVTARWNEDLLKDAGFRSVECYWRHLNFAAWVAVK